MRSILSLRHLLLADALSCAALGVVLLAAPDVIGGWTALPSGLLIGAGLALLPIAAFMAVLTRFAYIPGWGAAAVILGNVVWVAGSLLPPALGLLSPNGWGWAFLIAQAAFVALMAALEARAFTSESRDEDPRSMPGCYAVGLLQDVRMGAEISDYLERIDATLAPFQGRYVIHGGVRESLEGHCTRDLIVIGFPDRASASAWYGSAAYQAILPLRLRNSRGDVFLIEGVSEDHRATDILRPRQEAKSSARKLGTSRTQDILGQQAVSEQAV